jgi:hypothetical protein
MQEMLYANLLAISKVVHLEEDHFLIKECGECLIILSRKAMSSSWLIYLSLLERLYGKKLASRWHSQNQHLLLDFGSR